MIFTGSPADGKVKILVVEDDAEIVQFYSEVLSDRFNVVIENLGKRAIERLTDEFKVALIDYKLPDISGLEVLQKLKELRPSLPVVMITGYGSEDLAVKAFRFGVKEYIKKPCGYTELINSIDFCLSLESLSPGQPRKVITAEYPARQTKDTNRLKTSQTKIQKVLKYIEDNHSLKLSLDAVAYKACMSKFHFSKVFKQIIGCTYQEYLKNTRLNHARKMLSNNDLSITEVAFSVGYSDSTHFLRVFKSTFGYTPSQYKKERKHSASAPAKTAQNTSIFPASGDAPSEPR